MIAFIFRRLPVSQTKDTQEIRGVSVFQFGFFDRLCDSIHHHLYGSKLKEQDALYCRRSCTALRPHGDDDVSSKVVSAYDAARYFQRQFLRDDVGGVFVGVHEPLVRASDKVLLFDVNELLCRPCVVHERVMYRSIDVLAFFRFQSSYCFFLRICSLYNSR